MKKNEKSEGNPTQMLSLHAGGCSEYRLPLNLTSEERYLFITQARNARHVSTKKKVQCSEILYF